jgi:hypothetical protein
MTAIPKTVARIAAKVLGILKRITRSERLNKNVAMPKVIEFYILKTFRRLMKWVGN